MSIHSMNVRGLGKAERVRALSKLIVDTSPVIMFLKETMCPTSIVIETLDNILPGWK